MNEEVQTLLNGLSDDEVAKVLRRALKEKSVTKLALTKAERDAARHSQNYECAVCSRHESIVGTLHADHDHESGKFRGMLCRDHNIALGLVGDDVEVLERMISYLQENQPVWDSIDERWRAP